MKISKEYEILLESLLKDVETSSEEVNMSDKEKNDIYKLTMGKIENNQTNSKVINISAIEKPKRKIKFSYLLVATIAVLSLMGAGYGVSVYFEKMYKPNNSLSTDYDAVKDNPETLLEKPELKVSTNENITSIIKLDSMGRLNLQSVFENRKAGELFETEIHTPSMKAQAKGLTGDGLNLLSIITNEGVATTNAVVNSKKAPSAKSIVDQMISQGRFMVTIEGTDYTAIDYSDFSFYQSIHYKGKGGELIGITFNPHSTGPGEMPQSTYDGAKPEDLTINDNKFVLIKVGDAYIADLYLEDNNHVTNTVTISFGDIAKDREKVVSVLEKIKVHNNGDNKLVIADKDFFASSNQPIIKDNAEEIANSLINGKQAFYGDNGSEVVWEKDNVKIRSYESGWKFNIEYAGNFDPTSNAYPYNNQHTKLVGESWFPKDKLNSIMIEYTGVDVNSSTYFSQDDKYKLSSTITKNLNVVTALDAIIAEASLGEYAETTKVIDPTSDSPIVVMLVKDKNTAIIFSATKTNAGKYLVEKLVMPINDLPKELQ